MAVDSLAAQHHPDCYPSDGRSCLAFFKKALAQIEPAEGVSPLVGIVTPHIDFRVSIQSYAIAFRPLMDLPPAKTYIILGVGHRSRLEWNLDRRDYLTPLGRAECAGKWVEELAAGAPLFEPAAHVGEHSIEFPLVWLQAIHRLREAPPVRFVPLLCGGLHACVEGMAEWDDLHELHRLGRALGAILRREKDVRIIVSIDGCHLGPRFQHPFRVTPRMLEATAAWETDLWKRVAQGGARPFLEWMRAEGNDRYFDGVGALALLLAAGGGKWRPVRTAYRQWFTEHDASAVTFSSGIIPA